MNAQYEKALQYAAEKNGKLTCDKFKWTVEVIHQDHSHFFFHNAMMEEKQFGLFSTLIVWTEHCGYQVFFCADLEWWSKYKYV